LRATGRGGERRRLQLSRRDAMVEIYRDRFQMQVEAANTEVILRAWK
jgi:hypothetical protein